MRRHPVFKAFPSKAALLVVLALQLVLGLQLQFARAATSIPFAPASVPAYAAGEMAAAAQPDCPTHPHDCCHATACQCHCVYTPGTITLPALASIATSVAIPFLLTTQFVAPHIDELFRPPIA